MIAATPPPVAPVIAPQHAPTSRPPPSERVIEHSDAASNARVATDPSDDAKSSELTASARRFAAIMQVTGDVRLAASLSGLPVGSIDTYA
jgi:hypothetical protein